MKIAGSQVPTWEPNIGNSSSLSARLEFRYLLLHAKRLGTNEPVNDVMPKKIRELIDDLKNAGFSEITGGKGSHRKFTHPRYSGAVTLSGNAGSDAKAYQEKQVRQAVESVK